MKEGCLEMAEKSIDERSLAKKQQEEGEDGWLRKGETNHEEEYETA